MGIGEVKDAQADGRAQAMGRVLDEFAEVTSRLDRLTLFLDKPQNQTRISGTERALMQDQHSAMVGYRMALRARLELALSQGAP